MMLGVPSAKVENLFEIFMVAPSLSIASLLSNHIERLIGRSEPESSLLT
jgi:hypothetical protein